MRVKTFYRALRLISAIVLFFFVWTFGPIWQAVAFAAESRKASGVKREGTVRAADARLVTSGEKFEKNLESIRELVNAAAEKSNRGQEPTAELDAIKAKKAQIETIDTELKNEFAVTEKRLKASKLPQVILDRHTTFVKNYETNLAQLKSEIDDIDKSKTTSDRKAKIEKTKLHLEQVKSPTKHVQLDPNNLPFKARKATKTVAPRLKKEDFERDFPQQKKIKNLAMEEHGWTRIVNSAWSLPSNVSIGGTQHSALSNQPILLAFNEYASDIPLQLPRPSGERAEVRGGFDIPQLALSDSSPFLLAQATAQPTVDDLAETPEVQFTDAIRAKAQELGCSPVRIYEEIRNSIEFVPTYGSIQGADMCLQTKQCNAFDTSSLLISLFRSCNIPAHYVYSTVEIPIDKAMNWVGGFTDPRAAVTFIASGGIPIKPYASGGIINKIQMEHVTVEAYVPYGPYSGRASNLNPDKIWVPLDPSYKQYTYTNGIDLQSAVPFDAQAFTNQIQSTATVSQTEGYVTGVDSNYIQATMTDYQTQIQNYIQQNKPNATVGDVVGKKEIRKQELGILPVTLPYKVITVGTKYSEVPDNLRHKMTFEIQDSSAIGNSLSYTISIPEIAGKRLTLSYAPASAADQQVVDNYGGFFNTPAYLVNMTSQIKIEGVMMASGNSIGLGNQQTFNMKFASPNGTADSIVSNNVTVGAYYGIGVDANKVSSETLKKRKSKLEAIKKLADGTSIYTDDYLGELIYTTAMVYFFELDTFTDVIAKKYGVVDLKHVSEAIVSKDIRVACIYGIPMTIADASMMIDVDRLIHSSVSQSGDVEKEFNFTVSDGQISSCLEHMIFEQIYQGEGISAIKLLSVANSHGIPIYTIDQNNAAFVATFSISDDVKNDIQNAINAGKTVIISDQNINYNGWTGVGYIIMDPQTGSGAYMINAVASGGQCTAAGGCDEISIQNKLVPDELMCPAVMFSTPLLVPLLCFTIVKWPIIFSSLSVAGLLGALALLLIIFVICFYIYTLIKGVQACINIVRFREDKDGQYLLAMDYFPEDGSL